MVKLQKNRQVGKILCTSIKSPSKGLIAYFESCSQQELNARKMGYLETVDLSGQWVSSRSSPVTAVSVNSLPEKKVVTCFQAYRFIGSSINHNLYPLLFTRKQTGRWFKAGVVCNCCTLSLRFHYTSERDLTSE